MLLFQRLYPEAIEQLETAIALDENFYMPHQYLGQAYCDAGRFDRVVEHLEAASTLSRGGESVAASLGVAYARAGRKNEAAQVLSHLETLSRDRYVSACEVAQIHAALGDPDAALSWLEEGYRERAASLAHLLLNPVHDNLQTDSRFLELSSRVGLSKP